jgi:SAM-dependent methyltransferase
MAHHKLYHELARFWPLLSPPEEYAEGARVWRQALRDRLGPGRHRILELGAGGGHHLSHLTRDFEATAVDLSEEMLAVSRALNPGVEHHVGDMRSFRLDREFDAVLVHDAIGYMITEEDLRTAFDTAAAHLGPGGILILGPDNVTETFEGPQAHQWVRSDGATELAFFEYDYDPDPDDTTHETLLILVIREGSELRIEQERHTIGLFPLQTWIGLMGEAGFDAEKIPDPSSPGRHAPFLLVGTRRESG